MALQKVNGTVKQGTWFERDMSILKVEATGFAFSMPASPNNTGNISSAETVMNILQTRGTIIGYNVVSDTEAHFMFGHAAGAWGTGVTAPPSPPGKAQPDVIAELTAALDAIGGGLGTFTLTPYVGFIGADPVDDKLAFGHDDAASTRYR